MKNIHPILHPSLDHLHNHPTAGVCLGVVSGVGVGAGVGVGVGGYDSSSFLVPLDFLSDVNNIYIITDIIINLLI